MVKSLFTNPWLFNFYVWQNPQQIKKKKKKKKVFLNEFVNNLNPKQFYFCIAYLILIPTLTRKWVKKKEDIGKNKEIYFLQIIQDMESCTTLQTPLDICIFFKCKIKLPELCNCYSSKGHHEGWQFKMYSSCHHPIF